MTAPRPAPPARTTAATPPVDPGTTARLTEVAAARGRLWAALAELFDGTPAVTAGLRTGALPPVWRSGLALFAGQTPAADRALLVLEAHARGARHRTEDADTRTRAEVHAQTIAPLLSPGCPVTGVDAATDARAVAALCAHEADAWAAGDAERAAAARRAQVLRTTDGELEHAAWAVGRALAGLDSPPWRAVGTLVQTFVASETGRQPAS